MRTKCYRLSFLMLLAGLAAFAPAVYAKNKKPKAPLAVQKDEIEVVGHIPLTDGPVSRFLTTQHYSSYYLYAEHGAGRTTTLVDVTKTSQPTVLADVTLAPSSGSDSLALVAGTAALVTNGPLSPAPAAPQTITIMDFSAPQNPKVARVFAGVTAMSRDDGRSLIFIANADGIWILHQRLAQDPEVEKAYQNYVLYGSSMYPPSR
jgi:hypothetical protein